jgi:hypothetical protein
MTEIFGIIEELHGRAFHHLIFTASLVGLLNPANCGNQRTRKAWKNMVEVKYRQLKPYRQRNTQKLIEPAVYSGYEPSEEAELLV